MTKYDWAVLRWLTPKGSLRVGRINPQTEDLEWRWIMVSKRWPPYSMGVKFDAVDGATA